MECSMCGDVGFADHLFQCSNCRFRFQHKYCSRAYFYGDRTELCDWCFVESDQSGGSRANLQSKSTFTKNVDGKSSNASNSRRSSNAFGLKRKGDEARLTVECNHRKANMAAGFMRNVTKTNLQNTTRLAPPRSRQRMKFLHEILC